MTRIFLGLLLIHFSIVCPVFGQHQAYVRIVGSVKDIATNENLLGANVFIDNTSIGTTSDIQGKFILNVHPGTQTIVISFVGYETFHRVVTLKTGSDYQLHIKLNPESILLDGILVISKKDEEWSDLMERFEMSFLGTSENGRSCQILNPWVIEFKKKKDSLIVTTASPILIQNKRLGYEITFHLSRFYENTDKRFQIEGFVQFKISNAQDKFEESYWDENRRQAYQGSTRHFFQALIKRSCDTEGFLIYADRKDYQRTFRSKSFAQELSRAVDWLPADSILIWPDTTNSTSYRIKLNHRIEIHYLKSQAQKKLYNDIDYQVSWLVPKKDFLIADTSGVYSELSPFSISGSMSLMRIGDLLPFDYSYQLVKEGSKSKITGQIFSSGSTKAISNAMIFFGNTTIGTFSNDNGEFSLPEVAPGYYDLHVFAKDYSIFSSRMRVEGVKNYRLKIDLEESTKIHKASKKINANREVALERAIKEKLHPYETQDFPRDSISMSSNSGFRYYQRNDTAWVFSKDVIDLYIKPLGYQVHLCLNKMIITKQDTILDGVLWYETIKPISKNLYARWNKNRIRLYVESKEFFLQKLLQNRLIESGFNLVNKRGEEAKILIDSTNHKVPGYTSIFFEEYLVLTGNHKLAINDLYLPSTLAETKIHCPEGNIVVSSKGNLFDKQSLRFHGNIHQNLIWRAPINYEPPFNINFYNEISDLQESFIVHTDKDYYYPREYIWIAGYVFNKELEVQDSLSKIIHFQLLDRFNNIAFDKIVEIDNSHWSGYIHIPDTLRPDLYFLRVYTNWNRNYSKELFIKPIPILEFNSNFTKNRFFEHPIHTTLIQINQEKISYKRREKISISFKAEDANGLPIELLHCSVSVTDTTVVKDISDSYLYDLPRKITYLPIDHKVIERGVPISGLAYISNEIPFKGQVQLINFDNVFFETTNSSPIGLFSFHKDLKFYNSSQFYIRGIDHNRNYVKLSYKKINDYPEQTANPPFDYDTAKSRNMLDRIVNNFQPGEDVIMLNEVVVEDKKIETLAERTTKITILYGQADKTISGDEILRWGTGPDWLQGLNGRVPGVKVQGNKVTIRGESSFTGDSSPLFLVDGIPGSIAIDPSQIDRVEIVKRASPIYGSRGSSGIIAVYTKSNASHFSSREIDDDAILKNATFKENGFEPTLDFVSPDYSSSHETKIDMRTTIYWNPSIKTTKNAGQFSFYAGDIKTTYKVQIVGLTKDYRTVSTDCFIKIVD